MTIIKGNLYKVNMAIVKKRDNIPPYIRLVRQAIRNAEGGKVYVSEVQDCGLATIRSWELDIMGDVSVPVEALS